MKPIGCGSESNILYLILPNYIPTNNKVMTLLYMKLTVYPIKACVIIEEIE